MSRAEQVAEQVVERLVEQDIGDIDYGPPSDSDPIPVGAVYAGSYQQADIAAFLQAMPERTAAEVGTKYVYRQPAQYQLFRPWWIKGQSWPGYSAGGRWTAYTLEGAARYLWNVRPARGRIGEQGPEDVDMGGYEFDWDYIHTLIVEWMESDRGSWVFTDLGIDLEDAERMDAFLKELSRRLTGHE